MLMFGLIFFLIIWCIVGTTHALYRFDSQITIKHIGRGVVVYALEGPLVWVGLPVLWVIVHVVEFVLDITAPLVDRFEKWYQE